MKIDTLDKLLGDSVTIEKKSLGAGDFVFHKGDPANHIFTVEEGQVKLARYTLEGRTVVLHKANAGESFAEAALFSDTYHCNAVATMPSQISGYPKKEILEIFRENPGKAEQFMALLADQVRTLRTSLELRNILSAKQRIFEYFLLTASPDNGEVIIYQSFKELAAELGLAHETFYRVLAGLEKEKIIRRDGKKIKIIKFHTL
jgi:CRP-like cAMP-binding protein